MVRIHINKHITIGNLYVPPRDGASYRYATLDTDISCIKHITDTQNSILTDDVNTLKNNLQEKLDLLSKMEKIHYTMQTHTTYQRQYMHQNKHVPKRSGIINSYNNMRHTSEHLNKLWDYKKHTCYGTPYIDLATKGSLILK